MINSLVTYANYFAKSFFSKEKRHLLVNDYTKWKRYYKLSRDLSVEQKTAGLNSNIGWLKHSQDQMVDDGFGTYRMIEGWTSSYPETSGYIIPTLIKYGIQYKDEDAINRAIKAADWLISIQKPSGGWQSLYIEHDRPEVVFNTGQVIRGMIAAYQQTKDEKYLNSAVKAADWLCGIQNEKGYWEQHVFMGVARVYDSYVVAPMLELYQITKNETYKKAAEKSINWIISEKQKPNGWFADCDNTIKHNDRPILHTISYTIDGMLDCGLLLQNEQYITAAQKAADVLLGKFEKRSYLFGRYDKNWNGKESMITTGCAQIAIVWQKLYQHTNEKKYLYAAQKMNSILLELIDRGDKETTNTKGALFGSFPLWGKYEKFANPNWATKYLADSLLMDLKTTE